MSPHLQNGSRKALVAFVGIACTLLGILLAHVASPIINGVNSDIRQLREADAQAAKDAADYRAKVSEQLGRIEGKLDVLVREAKDAQNHS